MGTLKVAVVGATGRMGRMIIETVLKDENAELVAAIDLEGHPMIGQKAGELVGMRCDVPITTDVESGVALADCLIDFTRPEGALKHLEVCRRSKVSMVIGTTGFDDDGRWTIAEAAKEIPIVFAPNMCQ